MELILDDATLVVPPQSPDLHSRTPKFGKGQLLRVQAALLGGLGRH